MLVLNLFVDAPLKATMAADTDQSTEGRRLYLGHAAIKRPSFLEEFLLPSINARDPHAAHNRTVKLFIMCN